CPRSISSRSGRGAGGAGRAGEAALPSRSPRPVPSRWCPRRSCPSEPMRACVIRATGGLDHIQLADVPAPAELLGPRDVRIAIRAAALNHLDLHVVRGLPLELRFPHILGADGAGVVDAVGAAVRSVKPGDRVMVNPGVSDYTCDYCRAGEHSLCVNYRLLGEHVAGTLCESIVLPEQNLAIIPTVTPPLRWAE